MTQDPSVVGVVYSDAIDIGFGFFFVQRGQALVVGCRIQGFAFLVLLGRAAFSEHAIAIYVVVSCLFEGVTRMFRCFI